MKRVLLAGALVASAFAVGSPASAFVCPPGTVAYRLPTGHTGCAPQGCDPMACPSPKQILQDLVACPTDIPVWSPTCRSIFGD